MISPRSRVVQQRPRGALGEPVLVVDGGPAAIGGRPLVHKGIHQQLHDAGCSSAADVCPQAGALRERVDDSAGPVSVAARTGVPAPRSVRRRRPGRPRGGRRRSAGDRPDPCSRDDRQEIPDTGWWNGLTDPVLLAHRDRLDVTGSGDVHHGFEQFPLGAEHELDVLHRDPGRRGDGGAGTVVQGACVSGESSAIGRWKWRRRRGLGLPAHPRRTGRSGLQARASRRLEDPRRTAGSILRRVGVAADGTGF